MQLQKQEHYINLQMDPLCDPLTTGPIQTGWEICIEPYPNQRFGCVDNPDRQFGNVSVLTRTRTRSDGPELLLTLVWTSGTSSSIPAHLSSSLVTSSILFRPSSTKAYPACVRTTADHFSHSSSSKRSSLSSSSVSFSSSSSALLSPCPSSCSSSSSLNSSIQCSLPTSLPFLPVVRPE